MSESSIENFSLVNSLFHNFIQEITTKLPSPFALNLITQGKTPVQINVPPHPGDAYYFEFEVLEGYDAPIPTTEHFRFLAPGTIYIYVYTSGSDIPPPPPPPEPPPEPPPSNGEPPFEFDSTMLMIIGGIACAVVGVWLFRRRKI